MATGGGDDLYECAVCLTRMVERNPRLLSCHHSFCEECLLRLLSDEDEEITCPTCRAITEVKNGNIKTLPINFYIFKMLAKETSGTECNFRKCQLCSLSPSKSKCESCDKYLCKACLTEHNDIPDYNSHKLLPLCETHGDCVTHLCMKCKMPACMTCMVRRHKQHKAECMDYTKGVENMREALKGMEEEIEEDVIELYRNLDDSETAEVYSQQAEQDINELREHFVSQLTRLDKLQNEIKKDKKDRSDKILQIKKAISDAGSTRSELATLVAKDDKALIQMSVDMHAKREEYKQAFPRFQQNNMPAPNNLVYQAIWKERCPTLDLHDARSWSLCEIMDVTDETLSKIQAPVDIVSVGMGKAAIAAADRPYVQIINKNGTMGQKYFPSKSHKPIVGLAVHSVYLFTLQSDMITKINLEATSMSEKEVASFRPAIRDMSKLLVVHQNRFIISASNAGQVCSFRPDTGHVQRVLCGLKKPTYLSLAVTEMGIRYVVTEEDLSRVNVYDETWKKLFSIDKYMWDPKEATRGSGHQSWRSRETALEHPCATVMTRAGSILIADRGKRVISVFGQDGSFLYNIKVLSAIGLSYGYPHLWVLGHSLIQSIVKCYVVTKEPNP